MTLGQNYIVIQESVRSSWFKFHHLAWHTKLLKYGWPQPVGWLSFFHKGCCLNLPVLSWVSWYFNFQNFLSENYPVSHAHRLVRKINFLFWQLKILLVKNNLKKTDTTEALPSLTRKELMQKKTKKQTNQELNIKRDGGAKNPLLVSFAKPSAISLAPLKNYFVHRVTLHSPLSFVSRETISENLKSPLSFYSANWHVIHRFWLWWQFVVSSFYQSKYFCWCFRCTLWITWWDALRTYHKLDHLCK